jgi:hypothetical protein
LRFIGGTKPQTACAECSATWRTVAIARVVWQAFICSRLGDASAVALTKVMGGETITVQQMNQILLIVTLSFQAPKMIGNPADREPKTTMFLLKYLDCSNADRTLREKIAETKASLLSLNTEKH